MMQNKRKFITQDTKFNGGPKPALIKSEGIQPSLKDDIMLASIPVLGWLAVIIFLRYGPLGNKAIFSWFFFPLVTVPIVYLYLVNRLLKIKYPPPKKDS
jgi:hypothetical protein